MIKFKRKPNQTWHHIKFYTKPNQTWHHIKFYTKTNQTWHHIKFYTKPNQTFAGSQLEISNYVETMFKDNLQTAVEMQKCVFWR